MWKGRELARAAVCATASAMLGGCNALFDIGEGAYSPDEAGAVDGMVPVDAESDAPADSPLDSPLDAPADSPFDSPFDAPFDSPIDAPVDGGPDAPADAPIDSPPDSPADAPTDSPPDSPPAPCTVIFVDAVQGSDVAAGCSKTSPVKTLARAIASASVQLPAASQLSVCEGDYDVAAAGGLVVPNGMTLRGGFDCATWLRGAVGLVGATYVVDHETRIKNSYDPTTGTGPTAVYATLQLSDGAVVDGVSVSGPTPTSHSALPSPPRAVAVTITGNATLHASRVSGSTGASVPTVDVPSGGGPAISPCNAGGGTAGIAVESGAPSVTENAIAGGAGIVSTGALGSVGILVEGGSPSVHSNVVAGGSGYVCPDPSLGPGAVGVALVPLHAGAIAPLTGGRALSGDTIVGGAPAPLYSTTSTAPLAVVGVYALGVTVDLLGERIAAAVDPISASFAAEAVHIGGGGTARIFQSKLDGADMTDAHARTTALATDSSDVVVANSMIRGGMAPAATADQPAILVSGEGDPNGKLVLVGNTIALARGQVPPAGRRIGALFQTTRTPVVRNNLLIGTGDLGFAFMTTRSAVSDLEANALVLFPYSASAVVLEDTFTNQTTTDALTWTAAQAAPPTGSIVASNVRADSTSACPSETGAICLPLCTDGDQATCLGAVLPNPMLDSLAWAFSFDLAKGAACELRRGGRRLDDLDVGTVGAANPLNFDFYGTARDATQPAIGAVEVPGACP